MNCRNSVCTGALIWALPLAALAVSPPEPSADDQALEALLKREVQGPSRYAQSVRDAPAAVSVIGRDESAALGHQTVGDLLARLPGVYLSNSRTYTTVGLRGFNRPGDYSTRVLMAVDGQRFNDAIYDQGLVQLEFPVMAEWIKRVELVQGPGSSVYGSNALLGVVNVVTLDGADAPGLALQTSLGARGGRRAEAHYGTGDALGGDLFIGVNLQREGGEDLYLPELGTPDGWVRGLDGERQAALLAKYRRGPWRLSLNAVQRDKEAATAPYGTLAGAAGTRYTDRMVTGEVAYDEGWQGDLRRSVRLSMAHFEFRGRYLFGQSPDQVNKDEAHARWTTVEARVLWRGLLNHEFMAGAEVRSSPHGVQINYDVDPYSLKLQSRVSQDAVAAYAQDQWRLSSALHLTTGLRVDKVRRFEPAVSPRAVLAYRPDERESVKLMWSSSFRSPNLYERYYDDGGVSQVANAGLRPERLNSLEAAWEYLRPGGPAFSASVYVTRLASLIEQVPLSDEPDGVTQFRNVGRASLRGLDLGIEQRLPGAWLWRASASWMDARNDAGERLSNAPRWMLKGHVVSPRWQGWQLGAEAMLIGPRLGRVDVPTAVSLNGHLRHEIDARHTVALHVNNLLDRRNLDPATPDLRLDAIPQPGRAWRLDWRILF